MFYTSLIFNKVKNSYNCPHFIDRFIASIASSLSFRALFELYTVVVPTILCTPLILHALPEYHFFM
jgi:hypothetical protein